MEKREKLKIIKEKKIEPYPEKVLRDLTIEEFLKRFNQIKKALSLAGRVMSLRSHGKILFAHIQDETAKIQIVLKQDETNNFQLFDELIDIGDIILVKGKPFLPKSSKEKSLLVKDWILASKSIKNFPREYYKVRDEELLVRNPYLKTIFYPEERKTFELRFLLIQKLREILWEEGFLEVETPILQTHYGGALANPFVTYLEALKQKLYLRIAPELYLKKMVVGHFWKIFEIGKNFRNEGIDREHNPEFTMLELYWAFQDREGLMNFTQKLIQKLILAYKKLINQKGLKIEFQGKEIDFSGKNWPRVKYVDLIKEYTGLDFFENSLTDFQNFAKGKNIIMDPKIISKGKIVDEIYKKIIRPKILQPMFLIDHPVEISPLAKTHPEDPRLTLRFQLIVGGLEVANAFAELNDPEEQKKRFEEQAKLLAQGEKEAHPYDETFVEALEYGMPPTAGLGIGLDRLIMILLNKRSVREVIYFPFVRE
jgi:lysyl-tRNA synthetase class 2